MYLNCTFSDNIYLKMLIYQYIYFFIIFTCNLAADNFLEDIFVMFLSLFFKFVILVLKSPFEEQQ